MSTTTPTMSAAAADEAPATGTGRLRLINMILELRAFIALIVLIIVFSLLSDSYLTYDNLVTMTRHVAINALLAIGMLMVILTGGIDLSVGSILAAAAMIGVIASLIPGWGLLGIPAALLTGLFFGLLNGGLIALLKLPPFIVTLGALTAIRGVARLIGNDQTVFNADLPFAWIGNGTIPLVPGVFSIPVLALIAILVIIVSWFILRRTVLGTHIYAVGGNPAAARLSGIKVWLVLLFVYATSGVLAGLGGVMSAARLYAANGLQLGQAYELDAIAAVILGGTSFIGGIGSIWGTLIGALIIAALTNGLILVGVSDIWQFIIKGLVIIGAVTLDRFRTQGART
jgi:ribose transport system permease protein